MSMNIIFIFFVGAAIGSFLNVLIDRLPRGEQVLRGRSYCDHCHHKLAWPDLIPLVSFLSLLGRCRYCRFHISWQNPLVEFTTGLLFLSTFIFLKEEILAKSILLGSMELLAVFFLISCLIVIFFTDLHYQIIPDQIVYPAILISLIYNFIFHFSTPALNRFGTGPAGGFIFHLAASLTSVAFFLFLVMITRGKGMGMGDVKLVGLMGLFLGFPKIVVALYFAFLTGALAGVILILVRKKKIGQTIPFGPFLVVGTWVALFLGDMIIAWWQKFV